MHGAQDTLTWRRQDGGSHEARQEGEDDEAAVNEVEEIGVRRAEVEGREDGTPGCDGRRVEAVHEGHKADHAQDADDLVDGCHRGAGEVHTALGYDDEDDLHSVPLWSHAGPESPMRLY